MYFKLSLLKKMRNTVNIVAYRIISLIRYNSSFIDFEAISNTPIESLRSQLASLEEGAIFRDYGMLNLLEGDFFSWYAFNDNGTQPLQNL